MKTHGINVIVGQHLDGEDDTPDPCPEEIFRFHTDGLTTVIFSTPLLVSVLPPPKKSSSKSGKVGSTGGGNSVLKK